MGVAPGRNLTRMLRPQPRDPGHDANAGGVVAIGGICLYDTDR
jgi:hypothetical protein